MCPPLPARAWAARGEGHPGNTSGEGGAVGIVVLLQEADQLRLVDHRVAAAAEHLVQELVDLVVGDRDGQVVELVSELLEGHLAVPVPIQNSKQVVGELLVGWILLKVIVHLGGHDGEEFVEGHGARVVCVHLLEQLVGLLVGHVLPDGVQQPLELLGVDVAVVGHVVGMEGVHEALLLARVLVEVLEGPALLLRHLRGRAARRVGARGAALGGQLAQLPRVGLHGAEHLEELDGGVDLLLAVGALNHLVVLLEANLLGHHEGEEDGVEHEEGEDHGHHGGRHHGGPDEPRLGEHLPREDLHDADDVDRAGEHHRPHEVHEEGRARAAEAEGPELVVLGHVLLDGEVQVLGHRVLVPLADLREGRGGRRRELLDDAMEHVARPEEKRDVHPAPEDEDDASAQVREHLVAQVHGEEAQGDEEPGERVDVHHVRGD
mmetsp:Transcript_3777/g.12603  ORF Transcript_3777/g.12603 Transcript_3777/m.12603 type:complete len:434 (-) Transcript_3777:1279-2580(-)